MRTIFLGAPGTGKGTQAGYLSDKLGIPQISTGDILRKAVKEGTELGKKAKEIMEAGGLVSDDIIIGLIEERLQQSDCEKGYILDGFPRTIPQAEALDKILASGEPLSGVVFFAAPEELLIKRLTSRRVCLNCGYPYNVITDPPPTNLKCTKCDGGEIIHRDDDKEETVKNRLDVYEEKTAPLKDYYEKQGKLNAVNGAEEITKLRAELMEYYASIAD